VGDEWEAWIGRKGQVVVGPYPVSVAAIGYVAEAVEDGLLLERIAAGGLEVAPPTFVNVAARIPNWQPRSIRQPKVLQAALVPLPADAAVNRHVAQRYLRPLLIGDSVTSQSTIVAIEPKTTSLGKGFMVSEEIEHRNQRDEVVATTTNTVFRYDRSTVGAREGGGATPPAPPATPAPAAPGAATATATATATGLAPVVLPITVTMLVKAAGGVRDFIPLHHNAETAKKSGLPTMFASWSTLLAVIGRAVGEWCGLDAEVGGVSLDMRRPVFVDRTLTCEGSIDEAAGRLDYALRTEDGTCTTGVVDIGRQH
jgi:acyl dehydratase